MTARDQRGLPAGAAQREPAASTPAGRNKRRLQAVVAFTTLYLVVEVVGGIVTGSLALLADAGHMLTDVGALVLALIAIRFAERPATPDRSYGYARAEILAALVNAVVLILISVYIVYEAYRRFQNPPEVATGAMLIVGAVGLGVNLAGALILRRGATESLNMKGAYFEVISDMLTSVGVLVAAGIMALTGWYYADPIVSAGIGLFILPRTWRLLREAIAILLEGTPADVDPDAVRRTLASTAGVLGVHDLHIWALTSGMNALSVHVVVEDGTTWADVVEGVRERVTASHAVHHLTVQVEPRGVGHSETHL